MGGKRHGWFWPYGSWYTIGTWTSVIAVSDAASGHSAATVMPEAAVGLAVLGVTAVAHVRYQRSGAAPFRLALEALVRERAGTGAWLNRDVEVVFFPEMHGPRWMPRIWTLTRADAGQGTAILEDGRAPVTVEVFRFTAPFAHVLREADGALVTAGGDVDPGPQVRGWRSVGARVGALRARVLQAGASELAEVLAQFRDAELIGFPEGEA